MLRMKKILMSLSVVFMMILIPKTEMVWAGEVADTELSINGMQVLEGFDVEIIDQAIDIVSVGANEKTQEEVEQYALDFMQGSQPENSIEVLYSCPMYGMDNSLTGYYVTFLRDGVPNGYTLISFLHSGSPIVEFSFEGQGIFTDIENPSLYINSNEVKYIGPDRFYVSSNNLLEQDKYVSLIDDSEITEVDAIELYQNTMSDLSYVIETDIASEDEGYTQNGIIDWNATILDYSTHYIIPEFGQGSLYWAMDQFEEQGVNCGPTACTNILYYWGWQYSDADINNGEVNNVTSMVDRSGGLSAVINRVYNRIDYGVRGGNTTSGVVFENVPIGFAHYFGTSAGTGVWNYKTVSGFINIYLTITEGCPMYVRLAADANSTGHAVMAIGRVNDTSSNQYIVVMDGWNHGGRWVKKNYFGDIRGHKIWVSCA